MADVHLHRLVARIASDAHDNGEVFTGVDQERIRVLIQAVCKEASGQGPTGDHIRLANALPAAVSPDTVMAIKHYLDDHVPGYHNTIVIDFAALAVSSRHAEKAHKAALKGAQAASDVHSWNGNAAHHLLVAASHFANVAQVLLKDDDRYESQIRYAIEKMQAGQQELAYAERHWDGTD